MKITRTSPLTKITNTLDLNVTEEQIYAFQSGSDLIQNIFPNLTPSEREFIKTGYTESDWNTIFSTEGLIFDEIDQRFYVPDDEV